MASTQAFSLAHISFIFCLLLCCNSLLVLSLHFPRAPRLDGRHATIVGNPLYGRNTVITNFLPNQEQNQLSSFVARSLLFSTSSATLDPNDTSDDDELNGPSATGLITLLVVLFFFIAGVVWFAKRRMGDPEKKLSLAKEEKVFHEHLERYRRLYERNLKMEAMERRLAQRRQQSTLASIKTSNSNKLDIGAESGNESENDGCKLTPQSSPETATQTPNFRYETSATAVTSGASTAASTAQTGAVASDKLGLPALQLDSAPASEVEDELGECRGVSATSAMSVMSAESDGSPAKRFVYNKHVARMQPKRIESDSNVISSTEASGASVVLKMGMQGSSGMNVLSDTETDNEDERDLKTMVSYDAMSPTMPVISETGKDTPDANPDGFAPRITLYFGQMADIAPDGRNGDIILAP